MSDFYKKFLVEEVPKAIPGSGKQVFLGAFGKHPGWDDHVEDLGLQTESLIATKMVLYVKGIGGEIDAGAWEKLEAPQVLPEFKHIFIWQRGAQAIVGRLWASSDGKGRKRYPMVVCAHCAGVPLTWALEQILPRLEQLEAVCVTTQTAGEVRAALDRTRAELREMVTRSPDTTTIPNGAPVRDRFVHSPQFGEGQEGLLRVLYQMASQFTPFAPGKFNPRADAARLRPQHVRAPWGAESPEQAVLLWSQLLQVQVDSSAPVLLVVPLQERWIDVTVGEPTREEFFCLRATPKALPLVSEVPYNIDDSFRQAARVTLEGFVAGRKAGDSRKTDVAPPVPMDGSGKGASPVGRLLKWLGGAGVILLGGFLVFAALRPAGPKEAKSAAPAGGNPAVPAAAPPVSPVGSRLAPAESGAAQAAAKPAASSPSSGASVAGQANSGAEERSKAEAEARARAESLAKAQADAREMAQREAERLKAEAHAMSLRAEEEAKVQAALKAEAEAKALADAREAARVAGERVGQAAASSAGTAASPTGAVAVTGTSGLRGGGLTIPPGSFTNSIGMVLIRLPFGYWVGQTEVTEAQFKKVMGSATSVAAVGAGHPVHEVSVNEANEFCRKLTELEVKEGALQRGLHYSLPTESQWLEYVGDARIEDSVTSLPPARRTRPEPVGSTGKPNQFGLFDVRGNVWEWCSSTNRHYRGRGGAFNGTTTRTLELRATWPAVSDRPMALDARRQDIGFRCVLGAVQ